MALIRRSFNLSVTMPRVGRLIEFTEGLSWYKMFIMQSSNYFSSSCQLWQTCVCACMCVSGLFIPRSLWLMVGPHLWHSNKSSDSLSLNENMTKV